MAVTNKRRIAFLSFDWDYEIVAEYYLGMEEYLRDRRDLQLVIFSAFGHHHLSFEPDAGSHKIFSLCDLKDYDGIVVQGNRTWAPDLRQRVVDEANALGKPVVSINYDLEHATTVGTDNYAAMYGLVDQVLDEYDARDVLFVNGLASSKEAQDRARAYWSACAAHNIAQPRFHQANWQLEEGVATALELLEDPNGLPQVIFCCNDDLAVGVQDTLQKHGVRVPADVYVTGFDNREIGRCVVPCVTTVDRDYRSIARAALRTMEQLMDGGEAPDEVYGKVHYLLRESTGHDSSGEHVFTGTLYSLDNSLKRFYEIMNNFQTSLFSASSQLDILSVCEFYAREVQCPNVYLTMSDAYLHADAQTDTSTYAPISHLMAHGGAQRMPEPDEGHIYASFSTKHILPGELMDEAPVFVVYPLRRHDTCVGTIVTEGVSSRMHHGFLTFCITLLAAGIENMRNTEMLRAANLRLDNLYMHDELTGLFNRFGMDRLGAEAYEHLLTDFGAAQFTFVDVDNMKGVNDEFGHEIGDNALRDTAGVIRRAIMGENAFAMRYGGDEFLIISKESPIAQLEREMRLLKQRTGRPYDLSLSIGTFEVSAADELSMVDAIRRADARMYETKRRRKVSAR